MNEPLTIPLFPLNTVLFPGGPLSLRIFEPRYLDMVSRCMKADSGFGVVLIRVGEETGPAEVHPIGTIARIRDWDKLPDGLLGITAIGTERFRVETVERADDGLHVGTVTVLPAPEPVGVPAQYQPLADWLARTLPELPEPWRHVTPDYNNADWVGHRLAELLPVTAHDKQRLLEIDEPLERLQAIEAMITAARQSGEH